MPKVHLDFETFSEADIRKTGAYRYARDDSTEVLMACYWLPGMVKGRDKPLVWLPHLDDLPEDLADAAADEGIEFHAHNAQFERAVWHYTMGRTHPDRPDIAIDRWHCTAVRAAAAGLPRSLGPALNALGGKVVKNADGDTFIKRFCKPRKPTRADPRKRIHPRDDRLGFAKGIKYCQDDVLGEMELDAKLPALPPDETRFYHLDLLMNERGLPIDLPLVHKAYETLQHLEADINAQVAKLTGGIKATQRDKMMELLSSWGVELENLRAQTVRDLLASRDDLPEDTKRLLKLRVEAGKASTKKLVSMMKCAHPHDHVIQGSFLMNGAHTGRYAGRLVQPQNFIRGMLKPFQQALVFELLDRACPDIMKMLYEWPIDTISQCMRGFIRAPKGYRFVVVDYTAIEARVLAWIAGEERMLRAYRAGVDVYKLMASSLFNIPIEQVDGEQRRLAKNLVLGCGYALGGARFVEYCANLGQVVEESFAKKAVKKYRDDHPNIVKLWRDVENAAADAITENGEVFEAARCKFQMRGQWLEVRLPSGRCMRYLRPRATPVERWGKPAMQISFQTDYHGKIVRETTYGGKLVENLTQAIARDVMREGMFAAEDAGYPVHGTVHDELLTLRRVGKGSAKDLEHIVCDLPRWTKGIPLNAEGFETERYRKG